jgi:hypothetical protein
LQLSVVQGLLSLQTTAWPGLQAPPEQASPVVHALPSLHAAVLLVWMHPDVGLQESSVHGLLSLQLSAVPAWQVPPPQTSPVVQAFPSLHGSVLFVWTHPVDGLQVSVVHGLLSLHAVAVPGWHVPPEQESPVVQAFPSSHAFVLFV